jgi:iron complex outermembrane receptor protein
MKKLFAVLLALSSPLRAADLTTLSLEELSNLEVTSVSKKPEKSFRAPAAVYVITQEDIHRSGVTSIPEALRLAPGVEVARINANQWSIGIRGFGSRLARSVLVLMDGRAVYNPLFAGTYWEVQDYPLDDIDRIEVIRGPGGALWGANAVNGVINIITKTAKDTQGGLLTAGAGSEERAFGGIRYGGKVGSGSDAYYRVYGKYFDRDASFHANGDDFDPWHMGQSGFRTDWNASEHDLLTVQGDLYRGRAGQSGTASPFSNLFGANLLSRWSRSFDSTSGFTLQVYYDRTDRHDPTFVEGRDTEDVDFQYRLALPGRQDFTWGTGYRATADQTSGAGATFFQPASSTLQTYSAFLQDEIGLIPERLYFIVGTKLENNDYSGWELQPSARLLGTPTEHQTLWAAVSRAVRTPSRLERDLTFNGLIDGSGFGSEKVIAYEAGYRIVPAAWLSFDAAGFYNDYRDLLSIESQTSGTPLLFRNALKGYSEGVELATDVQALSWWRFRGSYSLVDLNLRTQAGSTDTTTEPSTEGSSPRHQMMLHSLLSLPHHTELDPVVRYVSSLPAQNTPDYMELDIRAAWRPAQNLELSLVGQNLLHSHHPEFGQTSELERGVYGKVTWTW